MLSLLDAGGSGLGRDAPARKRRARDDAEESDEEVVRVSRMTTRQREIVEGKKAAKPKRRLSFKKMSLTAYQAYRKVDPYLQSPGCTRRSA